MRGGSRPGFGGCQPGAGRKPNQVPTERVVVKLTAPQRAEFRRLDGSAWLQGILNLLIADRPDALVMLLLTELEKKHGREWLRELAGKINERANREQ